MLALFDFQFQLFATPENCCIYSNRHVSIQHCYILGCETFRISVCNFQSMKSPVNMNSLLLKFYCYVTQFDERQNWRLCKR